ncbi:uncharacterized protein LOC143731507 isoform X2 [Siphateles boraxobius]|uniref:uncharacterized protein LOC143731507 isoform X2 n=1 Tax=Siphateles boraxobius TaxID=180520 RepID=UPI00406489DD
MDIINVTCGEIESAGGFVYVILPVILNHTLNGDCEQSWYTEDQCVADPDNPHRLIYPASSVSCDRLVTSRCVNLRHEIVCDTPGSHHKHTTMYRVRNETTATPNSDVKEVTPPLQLSDQLWWLLAVYLVLLIIFLMCLIQRKRIFRLPNAKQWNHDSLNK